MHFICTVFGCLNFCSLKDRSSSARLTELISLIVWGLMFGNWGTLFPKVTANQETLFPSHVFQKVKESEFWDSCQNVSFSLP
jgi:hypothetical protein